MWTLCLCVGLYHGHIGGLCSQSIHEPCVFWSIFNVHKNTNTVSKPMYLLLRSHTALCQISAARRSFLGQFRKETCLGFCSEVWPPSPHYSWAWDFAVERCWFCQNAKRVLFQICLWGEKCFFLIPIEMVHGLKDFFFLRHNVIPSEIGKYGSEYGKYRKYGKMNSLPS